MNNPTTSRFYLLRLALIVMSLLALTASTGLSAGPDRSQIPAALIRVDLGGNADLERFAATGLPVYTQLQTETGLPYLILPATPEQQRLISNLGFPIKTLEANVEAGATYYLFYARQAEQLSEVGPSVRILEQDGLRAIVNATPDEAELQAAQGVEIVRLKLHPLVTPKERAVTLPEQIEPDPVIQDMMDQVITSTVYSYDAGLSGEFPVPIGGEDYTIATRFTLTTTPIQKATQYTKEHFESLGLPVQYHLYTDYFGTKRNVIAEQVGISQPERIFMVTAHLDSITNVDPMDYAPGADDNASGSVGVLIAADILSQYNFDCTIRYALFTGEEQGLIGSSYYAEEASQNGDDIEAVLNLDMIGYNTLSSPPVMELHTRYANADDLAIANLFADVIDAYNLDLTPQIVQDGNGQSDHASFWDAGYPAILGIEDFQDFTPYYHEEGDLVDTLDIYYFTDFIKAAIGTMAHNGCLLNQGTLNGQVTDFETFAPIPGADVTAERSSGQEYPTQTGADGNYSLTLSSGTYTVTAEADGYVPYITSGVEITTDMTTTLNIEMQPCTLTDPDFTFAPEEPLTGEPVAFTGSVGPGSTQPVEYDWDFGDGHTGSGQVYTHTYTVSGTYTVGLTAKNCAAWIRVEHPITVTGVPGISVNLQSLDVEIPYGETMTQTLELGSSGELPLTWSLAEMPDVPWLAASDTSGELAPQDREEITLTLTAPLQSGIYTTTLHIESNDPYQSEINIPVSLEVPCSPLADLSFEFSPAAPRIGESVLFTGGAASGSLPVTYTWNFGDGSSPVVIVGDPETGHTFPTLLEVQSYEVSLTAENGCSLPISADQTVTVFPNQVFLPLMSLNDQ